MGDSDSDLTPQDDDEDDDDDEQEDDGDEDEEMDDQGEDGDVMSVTPRMLKKSKGKAASIVNTNASAINYANTTDPSGAQSRSGDRKSTKKKSGPDRQMKDSPLTKPCMPRTASGPEGRDRKRAIKVGELQRRRARDEKFGVGLGEGYAAVVSDTASLLVESPSESHSRMWRLDEVEDWLLTRIDSDTYTSWKISTIITRFRHDEFIRRRV